MSFKEKLCYLTWGDPHRWMPTAGREKLAVQTSPGNNCKRGPYCRCSSAGRGHTERPGTRSGPHHDRGRLPLYEIVVCREGRKLATGQILLE